jgi:tRNA1(Val) A37 N6-methylase TrmN6
VLDLGSGKGTVALLIARRLLACRVVGVEALTQSHELAIRNASWNRLEDRYEPRLGDLRDSSVLAGEPLFDLICGAPPFKRMGTGTLPRDPQRAAGRFEMRGGVEAYAEAAVRHLAPGGRIVLLMDGLGCARAQSAIGSAGLFTRRILGVRPRPDRAATYWIIEAGAEPACTMEETLCMREESGETWSLEYEAIRGEMDLPKQRFSPDLAGFVSL